MNKIRLSNTSQPARASSARGGTPYYDWKVFVDEDPDVLSRIDRVTYFLHPSFPDPVRTVDDPSTKFALEAKGWGEFEIGAKVHFKDGSTESTSYYLELGDDAGRK